MDGRRRAEVRIENGELRKPAVIKSEIDYGRLSFNDSVIRYECSTGSGWEVRLEDIAIVAEFVDPGAGGFAGPDYSLVLVDSPDSWVEAPMGAEGEPELLNHLTEKLGVKLPYGLVGRVDFASLIVWPDELAGRPLFAYHTVRVAPGRWWNPFRYWRLIFPYIEYRFTPEVEEFVKSRSGD
jgi:hypothetical protein